MRTVSQGTGCSQLAPSEPAGPALSGACAVPAVLYPLDHPWLAAAGVHCSRHMQGRGVSREESEM